MYKSQIKLFSAAILFCCAEHAFSNKKDNNWVGLTPLEMVPNAQPLGSVKTKFFNLVEPGKKKTDIKFSFLPKKQEKKKKSKQSSKKPTQNKAVLYSDIPKKSFPKSAMGPGWIGISPYQLSPHSVPLGSLIYRHAMNSSQRQKLPAQNQPSAREEIPFNLSLFGSTRAYYTDNVMRTKEGEVESGTWENSIGTSIETKPFEMGKYVTLVPRVDFLMQWANYEEDTVSDLLDYRFGIAKGGLNFYLPNDFMITTGLEYTFLYSQFSGDKLFDSVSPSLSLQKIFAFGENTFLMMDALVKYSNTKREINFAADNIFPDDGDNIQTTLNMNLIQTMGKDGQFIFMPGFGINRTEYLKNTQDGRVDVTYFAGVSFIWQTWEWLGFQLFSNYSYMDTNSLGKELLGQSSSYRAVDIGGSINLNHSF